MRTRRWSDLLLGAAVVAFAAVSMMTAQQGIGTSIKQVDKKCQAQMCNQLPQMVFGNCTCDFSGSTKTANWCFDNTGTTCYVPDVNVNAFCDGVCVGNPNMFCSKGKLQCQ